MTCCMADSAFIFRVWEKQQTEVTRRTVESRKRITIDLGLKNSRLY